AAVPRRGRGPGLSVVAGALNRRNTEFLRFRAHERGLARRIEVTDTVSALERSGRYSVVSCQHVLDHVADPRALLASLRDSLEEGGLFIGVAPFSLVNDEFPEHRLENAHLRLED